MRSTHVSLAGLVLLAATALTLAGCANGRIGTLNGRVRVVAAENFWGSIARQVGGVHAQVDSIIVNPAQDPHSYEPTTADARTISTAQLAILNGIGYDPWAPKLLAANPVDGRLTLSVGGLLHLRDGDNPHRWYDPADVRLVAGRIAADLERLYPRQRAYFAANAARFQSGRLAAYDAAIAAIRRRYAGVPVGASESIFALLAPSLDLDLITPPSFMRAISEGTEVTAQDTIATERQLTSHQVRVWVYNSQNVTPEVQRLNALARAAGIPIVTVTETLSPQHASFEQWQLDQLHRLQAALHEATGR